MKSLEDINTKTKEGKMLIAAIAKITTESQLNKTPDEVVVQVSKLKDDIYYN